MIKKTIRSHRARVIQAKKTLKNNSDYSGEPVSIIDREAFVEFFLLEDILKLYKNRLEREVNHDPIGRAAKKARDLNIKKFSAIIDVFNAVIGVTLSAINSGEYKKVWKAIHEGELMAAAKSVKNLPKLKDLAIEMLRDLSSDMMKAVDVNHEMNEDLDDLDMHEKNVRRIKNVSPTMEEIEEVIRVAENVISDKKIIP